MQVTCAVVGLCQNLYAIAGGKYQTFIHSGMLDQTLHGVRHTRLRNREALAHLQRSRCMVHADELEPQERTNL